MSAQEELSERKEEKTPSPRVNNRAAKTFRLISEEGKYKKKNSDEKDAIGQRSQGACPSSGIDTV
ncbi:hypothetical protein AAIH74_36580, partial [Pseudomonas aeruginosa]|uniref:hypothetical protein n=1 Tax=Pseudomonas aeruginosa TaxID=287 RepID=UPI0031B71B45